MFSRVHRLGYLRPGLILGAYEEARSALAHSATYPGWCENRAGPRSALPILRLPVVEKNAGVDWIATQSPDAIRLVNLPETIPQFRALLGTQRRRVPGELGVTVLSHFVEGTGFCGPQQNQRLVGPWSCSLRVLRTAISGFQPARASNWWRAKGLTAGRCPCLVEVNR